VYFERFFLVTGDIMADRKIFSADDILQGMYKAILGREPDSDGLSDNRAEIEKHISLGTDAREIAEKTINTFLLSTEYSERKILQNSGTDKILIARHDMESYIISRIQQFSPKSRGIPHINSLGSQCYCSSLLKNFGMRRWSGPFDWIFSNPEMIDFCIKDEFESFLDRKYYEFVPIHKREDEKYNIARHTLFQKKFSIHPPIFNHVEAHTNEGHDYLKRCVGRFIAETKRPGKKLFLQIIPEKLSTEENFFSNVDSVRRISTEYAFLRIVIREGLSNGPFHKLEYSEMKNNLFACCYVNMKSQWLATQFEDMGDDLIIARFVSDFFEKCLL